MIGKKQLDDELTSRVIYRTIYSFGGNDREILLMFMQKIPQREIAEKLGISASAVSQRLKVLKEDYRIMLCNDYEFKRTKQFRDLKWESKKALNQYLNGNYVIKNLDRCGQRLAIPVSFNGTSFYSGWLLCPEGKIKNTTPFGGWIK